MRIDKRLVVIYKDQTQKEKTKLIYLGYIDKPDLFQQLLLNVHPSTNS